MNPEHFLSVVVSVSLLQWGSELQIECLDDPIDRQRYILIFRNCRDIRWTILEPDLLEDAEAELIGFLSGEDKYQKPAIITTDIFEVSVLYETYEIQKK
jgi:hypothetical protein